MKESNHTPSIYEVHWLYDHLKRERAARKRNRFVPTEEGREHIAQKLLEYAPENSPAIGIYQDNVILS